ncbi:MAG TPA: acyl-CoA reductase [Aequorivita sp.]|nr:acyl-CoA reductase [Aequorivita sp.]
MKIQLKQRINAFAQLGEFLNRIALEDSVNQIEINRDKKTNNRFLDRIETVLNTSETQNGWFTKKNIKTALKSWAEALSEENLLQWTSNYAIENTEPKTIGIVMAGNIPLVGFHDFLSVLITGNKVLGKLSSNDKVLIPFLSEYLISIEPEFQDMIEFTEGRLENFDAVIATGSDNTSRYFDYYFGKYPNIIRKNRNSVAVLTGDESSGDFERLADDIFQFFGLGCRNVSKLYVPENYDFTKFFEGIYAWNEIIHNNKYINNYDYNKTVYLMDSLSLLDNGFLILKEDQGFSSPISVVFYEKYTSLRALEKELEKQSENIQCVVSKTALNDQVAFGQTQSPQLWEYADGVDTVDFLLKLH